MRWLVLVGPVLFVISCLVVGTRVLGLARRTRGVPEWGISTTLLSAGVGGYTLIGGVPLLPGVGAPVVALASLGGHALISIGCGALCVFTWKTFRPREIWAGAVVVAVSCILAVSAGALVAQGHHVLPYGERSPLFRASLAVQTGTFVWTSFEALRHWSKLQRRLRLGLVHPEIASRILMWGIASGSASLILALYAVLWLRLDGLVPTVGAIAALAVPGLVTAATTWLAFFPPEGWRRRFAREATRDPGA